MLERRNWHRSLLLSALCALLLACQGKSTDVPLPSQGKAPTAAGAQVPTYAPGLPLLMAVPHLIAGINGASAVVIASAVIAIICTGVIAAHLGGSIAGIIAASLIAFTPVFIYQSIQPMSDVPVTAAWMLCFALLLAGKQSASGWACASE